MSETITPDMEIYVPTREGTVPNVSGGQTARSCVQVRCLIQHDITVRLVEGARALRDLMAEQKQRFLAEAELYVRSMLAQYNADPTGKRGGFVIVSYDDLLKVELSVADYRAVDGAVVAAQALVSEVLTDLTEQLEPWVRELLDNAFNRDEKTGRINVDRLQSLRKVDIPHPKWPQTCEAIADSIRIAGSRSYLRFYERQRRDQQFTAISLQFSSL